MDTARPLNMMDVESLVSDFIRDHQQGIATLHRMYFKSGNQLSLLALQEGLVEELRTGCVSFINRGSPLDELDNYLFYIVNAYCKKLVAPQQKKKTEYLCPGCLFLGEENLVFLDKIFECDECKERLQRATDPKKVSFFRSFYQHNKNGYHCPDCERFIPHPMDNASMVSCPYFDCAFAGKVSDLKKMHHPTSQSNPEKLILDTTVDGTRFFKDSIIDDGIAADDKIEMEQELGQKVQAITEIIEAQMTSAAFSSTFTVETKRAVYNAFKELLAEESAEMVAYLLNETQTHPGFQNKLFQRFIQILESAMPFYVIKGRKEHRVESLLDDTLSLFAGISIFEHTVNDKSEVKNKTQEFYIGGRKGTYSKPYYIGKLLSIVNKETKVSLMSQVKSYGFNKIVLDGVPAGTPVIVTHLRHHPHYGMGGMTYVNRIRKKIVERAISVLGKS